MRCEMKKKKKSLSKFFLMINKFTVIQKDNMILIQEKFK
jgi:hypothetical protein